MSRADYQFVDTNASGILSSMISAYEAITGRTVKPADPERLFISWIAYVLINERISQNYVGNQNLPSRASGENLDALGEWIFGLKRKGAQAAKCTVRFTISEAQPTAISVPAGTRVTDTSQSLIWYVTDDAVIPIGSTYVDVMVQCETVGTAGNGYAAGQINTLIDVDKILFYSSCSNVTRSDGGAEAEDDETYFEMMRESLDAYSTAGPEGAYVYHAKSVSNEIADVRAIRPRRKRTGILTVYKDGSGNGFAFIGGNELHPESLRVYPESSSAAAVTTDYTVDYADGLLKISIVSGGSLDGESAIDIEIAEDKAGYVEIYALMDDGTPASETIKQAIYDECGDDNVRPMTDHVSVCDPDVVPYDIDLTYYISRDSQSSLAEVTAAVENAIGEYVSWQSARLGRDINPSKLQSLIMAVEGVKRVSVTSPTFLQLSGGADNSTPQVAAVDEIDVVNGGYEDD